MIRTADFRASTDRLQSGRSALLNAPNWLHLVLVLAVVAAVFYALTQPVRLATPKSLIPAETEPVVMLPEVIVTAPRRTQPTLDGTARTR